jgi:hypothetical protein
VIQGDGSCKSHRQLGGRYRDTMLGWGDALSGEIEVCQISTSERLDLFKSERDGALVGMKLRHDFDEVAATTSFDFGTPSQRRRAG